MGSSGVRVSSILSSARKSPDFKRYEIADTNVRLCRLEKEPSRRATPWRMLEHPWIVEMKTKKVNMAHFLAQVWDWKD